MATYFALTASGFFFALNGLWAIWSINSFLASIYPTQMAIAAREIVQFFFCLGSYLGLGLCSWRFPAGMTKDSEDVCMANMSTKRLTGPVEADSRVPIPEVGTSRQILEADASRPVVEAAATRPIWEADSNSTDEKSSTYHMTNVYH